MGKKQTHEFQAEVSQLLHLMIHSLYSNRDIFLRELISNASDACEKRRFIQISDTSKASEDELAVWIETDEQANTITIRDSGIGMSEEEVVENLGTIARSGTRRFLDSLSGEEGKDQALIGQFGVGFYSAFMVAEEVIVETRSVESDNGTRWVSNGKDAYSIESFDKSDIGTSITLKLRDDQKDYASGWKVRNIISTYSDHIAIPIYLAETNEDKVEWNAINTGTALWTKAKTEISTDDYTEFYASLSHDTEPPLSTLHNRVEGNLEYTSLLYIPKKAPFDLWDRESSKGIKLYVQRVFIMDDASQLLPSYLRFVKGVVDCADLPLNVSREILQDSDTIRKIKSALTKRILSELEKLAKDDEVYQGFWDEFGKVIKEGLVEDFENREKLLELARFASLKTDAEKQTLSLKAYVDAMLEKQDKIYYLTAESPAIAINSPQLEALKKHDLDVLLLTDPVDEWVVGHVNEYNGKPLNAANKGQVDLSAFEGNDDEKSKEKQKDTSQLEPVLEKMKAALADRVKDVRTTNRLTESPACVVSDEGDMGANLERILKSMGQEAPESKPILELNEDHPLITGLRADADNIGDWAFVLLDQALLAEGVMPTDPAGYTKRVNTLLVG